MRCDVVPSPTSPKVFGPQQNTAPVLVSAHVPEPAATAFTKLVNDDTAMGVVRCVVVPSPSSPPLLSPQQKRLPSTVTAQPWFKPRARSAMPPSPATGPGML